MDSLETVNQILTRVLPESLHTRLAYLSGPSFAAEVDSHTLFHDKVYDCSLQCSLWRQLIRPCQISGISCLDRSPDW